tara:strand:- start:374 stop:490 length:117 start_codon:yes stop_codon:yes gene_type:complete
LTFIAPQEKNFNINLAFLFIIHQSEYIFSEANILMGEK